MITCVQYPWQARSMPTILASGCVAAFRAAYKHMMDYPHVKWKIYRAPIQLTTRFKQPSIESVTANFQIL